MIPLLVVVQLLTGPVLLRGEVVDPTGAPVAGADVVATAHRGATERTRTDAGGKFELRLPTDLGATVTVTAPGFSRAGVSVARGTTSVRVELTPAGISETVSVSARADAGRIRTPASATVLDRQTIESLPALTIDDQLRSIPGFTLFRRTSSRTANPTTQGVTLRGLAASGASRTLVLSDGVPLNDPFGGWVYWDRIPAAAIERVEVTRGGSSDLHGSDALGGVIRIESAQNHGAHVLADGGSDGTARGSAYGGLAAGKWTLFGAAEQFTTDGYVAVAPESRGSIDVPVTSRHGSAYAGAAAPLARDVSLSLAGSYFSERRGNGTPFQTNGTVARRLAGRVEGLAWGGSWTARAYGGTQGYDQTFSAVAADRRSERPSSVQRVASSSGGASIDWTRARGARAWFVAGGYREVDATLDDRGLPSGQAAVTGARQRSASLTVQASFAPSPAITIGAGGRAEAWRSVRRTDGARNSAGFLAPRVSVAWSVTDSLSVRAGVQSGYRVPTINELYRPFRVGNVVTTANDSLDAERATGLEASALIRHGRGTLRIVGFGARLDRAIANVTIESRQALIVRQRQNAGGIHAAGIEAEAEIRLTRQLTASASGAWTHSVFADAPGLDGLDVPQVPGWQSSVGVTWSPRRALVTVQWRSTGPQFDDDRNLLRLDAVSIVDARAGWRPDRRVELFAAVENAFDAEQQVGRTPTLTIGLPRTARAGVRLTF